MDRSLKAALRTPLRISLVNNLNTNNRWERIVKGLESYRIPVILKVNNMNKCISRGMTPADWVLEELFDRLCSFDEFCNLLREFDLLEELSLLVPTEPMIIQVQPGNGEGVVRVNNGGELKLVCEASGLPRPSYQWYHDNRQLQNETNSKLVIRPFSEEKSGLYYCRVTQELHGHICEQLSSEVITDLPAERPNLLVDLPRTRSVSRGQTLYLVVQAFGYPSPRYEWFRSTSVLCDGAVDNYTIPNIVLDETSNTLEVKNTGPNDEGLYCCRIFNEAGEVFSSTCSLSVFERPPDYIASAKVALLIGNEDYLDPELQGLQAPSNDVATLAEILEGLGFHVISLHNLTHYEMYNAFCWFSRVLPENAYAFFYFAGHGFSKLASKFMMPIDCPKNNIQLEDCLCDEQLTKVLAEGNQLQLLVMLFDCCLLESRDLAIGRTEFEHDLGNCNIVLGTATRNHQNAYESSSEANGLFVNNLKSHLSKEIPIIEVLRENQKDFREKQQQPTILFSGADNCSLTDPIKGNSQLEETIRSEIDFPSYEQEVFFSKMNEHLKVRICKHKNCFLNSIDIEFPESFTHNFSVEINPEDVKMKVHQRVVTIYNIQKVKTPMCVTLFVNGLRQAKSGFVSGPHDSYQFVINCPIIGKGQLWHNAS